MITNVIVYTAANGSRYVRPIARVFLYESTPEKIIELTHFLQVKRIDARLFTWYYEGASDFGWIDIRGRYEGQPGDELEMIVKEAVKEWEERQ